MSRKDRIRKEYRKKNFSKIDAKYQVCNYFDCKGDEKTSGSGAYCTALKKLIKSLDAIIAAEAAKQLAANARPSKRSTIEKAEYLQILRDVREKRELEFTQLSCSSKITLAELQQTKDIVLEGFEQIDKDILPGSNRQRNTLFFIGGAVLLAGLTITLILTRKK